MAWKWPPSFEPLNSLERVKASLQVQEEEAWKRVLDYVALLETYYSNNGNGD